MDEQRLTRIEDKLDKLTEGFTALVRMDEKLLTVMKRMESYDQRQERLSERVALMERTAPEASTLPGRVTALEVVNHRRGPLFVWADRIAVALVTALVAAAFVWMRGGAA